jgi:N-acetylglucosaminyl-diphospho-decaprenol L-rhamnosyltransferase
VVVVDNASSDGSADNLQFSDLPLSVVRNSENRGFAAACNQGARHSTADYLIFLNPDVRLHEDSLQVPVQFMGEASNGKVGICGIQLVDESGSVSSTCSSFPTSASMLWQMLGLDRMLPGIFRGHFLEHARHRVSGGVDHVMGAFLWIRRSVFEALGGFDERFFVYWEDVDISYRASLLGWASYYLAEAQAFHKGRGCSEQVKDVRLFYSLRSRILYAWKHFSRRGASLVSLGTVLVEPFSRLAVACFAGSAREMKDTLRGFAMLWRALPEMVMKGRREHLKVQSEGTD